MNKELFAAKLHYVINMYQDYLTVGALCEHEELDFSYLNVSPPEPEEKKDEEIVLKEVYQTDEQIQQRKNEIIDLASFIFKCTKCPLHQQSNKVPGYGRVTSDIFVLNSVVTKEEEEAGRPMIGKSGMFFQKWLKSIDIDFEDIFITNVIKCSPKRTRLSREQVEACRYYLDRQIQLVQPKLMIVLGQISLSTLLRSFGMLSENHGKIFYYHEVPFIPLYHPMEVLSNPQLKRDVWMDLQKIRQLLTRGNQGHVSK
jgi:uracil-DNA glycosylase